MRAEIGREILVERLELLVGQRRDTHAVIEAAALQRVLVHLQDDDWHERMAVLAVLENEIATRPRRKDLFEIHSQLAAARGCGLPRSAAALTGQRQRRDAGEEYDRKPIPLMTHLLDPRDRSTLLAKGQATKTRNHENSLVGPVVFSRL